MGLIQWHFKNNWSEPDLLKMVIPIPKSPVSLKMVVFGRKHFSRPTVTALQSCSAYLYKYIKRGTYLGEHTAKGLGRLKKEDCI